MLVDPTLSLLVAWLRLVALALAYAKLSETTVAFVILTAQAHRGGY